MRKQKKAAKSSFIRGIEDQQKPALEGSTILPSLKQVANVGEPPSFTFAGSITSSSTGLTLAASTVAGHGLPHPMNSVDPLVDDRMHIAITDFIISNAFPFSLVHYKKFCIMVGIARNLAKKVSGPLLDLLFDTSYKQQINILLLESDIFGSTLFGDGATIEKFLLLTFWMWDQTMQLHFLQSAIVQLNWKVVVRRMLNKLLNSFCLRFRRWKIKLVRTIRSILEQLILCTLTGQVMYRKLVTF